MQKKTNPADAAWDDFLKFCNKNARPDRWFRGVSDSVNHKLVPKIGRAHQSISWKWNETHTILKKEINLRNREGRIFKAFQRRARLGLQFVPQTKFEWLAIAQHHGVPTRLLDWTANPLMAGWFAVSNLHPQTNNAARVYSVKVPASKRVDENVVDPFSRILKEPVFVVPPHWHARIRAQRGCFSIHPLPNEEFKPNDLEYFDIPQEYWTEFLTRLFYFGIDASTVLADLTGLGQALAWQYENEVGVGRVGY